MDRLDVLLTGGRLGAATKAAMLDVYRASGGLVENVKALLNFMINAVFFSAPTFSRRRC